MARNAFQGGDRRSLVPCKPSVACRARFVREFGLKAFRRPLEPDEQKRYEDLFRRETDFYKGVQLAVEAMLQSPHFLFRLEEIANPKWKPYVTATRLSYALWDSLPDEVGVSDVLPWHRDEVERRLDEAERNPVADRPWRDLLDEIEGGG